jgi:hypothetical protein
MLETNTKQISDLQQDKEAIEQKLNNKIKLKIPNVRVFVKMMIVYNETIIIRITD